jgi:2-polyprenyl-6-methoxyphenol hydroxylase-like FAD-dependent oxidoreductase
MLARRGHQVTLIDRDPGHDPAAHGTEWTRRGVMQFDLPHFFRPQVGEAVRGEAPELWEALLAAGARPATPPGAPEFMIGLAGRRPVVEHTIWSFTSAEPAIRRITGHADELRVEGGRVTGVVVDGADVPADLVVVCGGRAGKVGDSLRAPGESLDSGFSYAARQYRARPGEAAPDWGAPQGTLYDGYLTIVFPQDAGTLSALIVRPTDDPRLQALRHNEVFEAAVAAIPSLAEWTDPARFAPITNAQTGANLLNSYRGQRDAAGNVTPGVIFVGDAVLTTNPAAGRGVSTGMQQAREVVRLLDAGGELDAVAAEFDDWCETNMRPWFEDHVYWDATLLDRFAGKDINLDARIPSDVVCACAEVDPSIMDVSAFYLGMVALPSILDSVQDKARAVLETGWRPPYGDGPTREEVAAIITAAERDA